MRIQHLLIALTIPATVAAQPVTRTSPCEVTVSRAPDEVREAIEAWVRAEPRCSTTLDVRVVPTDGGFYLFARDPAGRVRERVVPDAKSAGVLVASWVADDLIEAMPPAPEIPADAPEPGATAPGQVAPVVTPIMTPPGEAVGVVATATADPRRGRWLTLGGIVQMHGEGAGGMRAELDLKRNGKWTLGAVLAGSAAHLSIDGNTRSSGYINTIDIRVLAQLARTTSIARRWEMRLAFAAGVMSTRATGELDGEGIEAAGMFPTAEASLLFTRQIHGSWAIAAGPIATWSSQTYKLEDEFGSMLTLQRRDLEVMGFAAFRRRL